MDALLIAIQGGWMPERETSLCPGSQQSGGGDLLLSQEKQTQENKNVFNPQFSEVDGLRIRIFGKVHSVGSSVVRKMGNYGNPGEHIS